MAASTHAFNFLGLPREIRDIIYEYALCTFSRRGAPYSIEQHARVHASAPLDKRWFLGTINLLFTNRQIYQEGYDYMIKTNLFVRIEFRGINVRDHLHGHVPPIHLLAYNLPKVKKSRYGNEDEEKPRKTDKFAYTMSVWIGIDEAMQHKRWSMKARECWDIVMLCEDFADFCRRFEIEGAARRYPDNNPLKMVIGARSYDNALVRSGKGQEPATSGLARHIQQKLLKAVREGFRGFDQLTISGFDSDLATEVVQNITLPLWTDHSALLVQIRRYEEESKTAWALGDYPQCASLCSSVAGIIDRLHPKAHPLSSITGEVLSYVMDVLTEAQFTSHMLLARCLRTELDVPPDNHSLASERSHTSFICQSILQTLKHCNVPHEALKLAKWKPSNKEMSYRWYLTAQVLRMGCNNSIDQRYRQEQVHIAIERAMQLCPGNEEYELERNKIHDWYVLVDKVVAYNNNRPRTDAVSVWEWMDLAENQDSSL